MAARPYALDKSTLLLQILGNFVTVKHNPGVEIGKGNDEQEVLELVDKVTLLRKQRIKLRRHIAAQVYAYAKQ